VQDRTPHKALRERAAELSKKEFAEELKGLADWLGQGGMDLLWWLEVASIKALKCEEHPVRAALLENARALVEQEMAEARSRGEPSDVGDRLICLIAGAYENQPLCHQVVRRIADDILDSGESLPNSLGRYFNWRLDNPIDENEIFAWLAKIERDHLVVSAMRFLIEKRKYKEWPAAQCVADVMRHIGVEDLSVPNVKTIWRRANEVGDGIEADKVRSLEAQEAALRDLYAIGPDGGGISFEEYETRLLRLKPESSKVVPLMSTSKGSGGTKRR
jgi:hypothetical protein